MNNHHHRYKDMTVLADLLERRPDLGMPLSRRRPLPPSRRTRTVYPGVNVLRGIRENA